MARRRNPAAVIAGGLLEGLGRGLGNYHEEQVREKERGQSFELSVLPARLQAYKEGRGAEFDAALAPLISSHGLPRLGAMPEATPGELTAGISNEITSARTPEEVPGEQDIISKIRSLGAGPEAKGKILAPGFGEMPVTEQTDVIPGVRQQGPVHPPEVQRLLTLAEDIKRRRLEGEGAAAERQFVRGEGQKERAFPAELGRAVQQRETLFPVEKRQQLELSEATARQGEKLTEEFSEANLKRKLAEITAVETNPAIRKAKLSDAIALQRSAQQLQQQFGPLSSFPVENLPNDQPVYGRDGKVRYTVPAGSSGFILRDQQGTVVGFQPASGRLGTGGSGGSAEIIQRLQNLGMGGAPGGQGPATDPLSDLKRQAQELEDELKRRAGNVQ